MSLGLLQAAEAHDGLADEDAPEDAAPDDAWEDKGAPEAATDDDEPASGLMERKPTSSPSFCIRQQPQAQTCPPTSRGESRQE